MNVLEMEIRNEENKEIFDFFKQLNIEDVKNLFVTPRKYSSSFHTQFDFEIKNGIWISFHYQYNKKISSIRVIKGYETAFASYETRNSEWRNYIWKQFVDQFNLHVRLMFINENIPWKWNTKFTY